MSHARRDIIFSLFPDNPFFFYTSRVAVIGDILVLQHGFLTSFRLSEVPIRDTELNVRNINGFV